MTIKENAKAKIILNRNQLNKISLSCSIIEEKQYNFEFLVKSEKDKIKVQVYFGKKGIKTVLQGNSDSNTYKKVYSIIFDEIETGVGGATATAIGERLKILSQHTQVLSITHSPQVTAKSDQHYLVKKEHQAHTTKTSVGLLTNQQRLEEIARMLSGATITEASLSAAKDLL